MMTVQIRGWLILLVATITYVQAAFRRPATGSATASCEPNANKRSRTRRKSLNIQGSSRVRPRSGRGGRRFKSCHSDQSFKQLAPPSKLTAQETAQEIPHLTARRFLPTVRQSRGDARSGV